MRPSPWPSVASAASATHTTSAAQGVFCSGPVVDFVNQVQHVEATANLQKSYGQYMALVTEANNVQAHVPWAKVTGVCLTGVGNPAKRALKLYNDAWASAAKYVNSAYNCLD